MKDKWDEKARELGKYFDWNDDSEQVHVIAQALREAAPSKADNWPSEDAVVAMLHSMLRRSSNGSLVMVGLMTDKELMDLDITPACIRATYRWLRERLSASGCEK